MAQPLATCSLNLAEGFASLVRESRTTYGRSLAFSMLRRSYPELKQPVVSRDKNSSLYSVHNFWRVILYHRRNGINSLLHKSILLRLIRINEGHRRYLNCNYRKNTSIGNLLYRLAPFYSQ